MRSRSMVPGSALLLALACGDSGWVQVSTDLNGQDAPPPNMLQGDTVQLYAIEGAGETDGGTRTGPVAVSSQHLFTWTSHDPSIVEVVGTGRLLAKGPGRAQIEVHGEKATAMIFIWVYPPDAAIRLAPRDTTIDLGGALTVTRRVFYNGSTLLQDDANTQVTIFVNFTPQNQVLRPITGTGGNGWAAVGRGSVYVRGYIELYKRPDLRDSILVTVR